MTVLRREADAHTRGSARAGRKSTRTRQRILDSAAYLLSVRGYARLRLDDVAEDAEIAGPAIYYYFRSRDELVAEVLSAGVAGMRENLERVLAAAPALTPLERVLTAAEEHLRYSLTMSNYPRASIRNSGQIPREMRTRQLEEEARYGLIWRDLIQRAVDEGQTRPGLDAAVSRMLVLGGLSWAVEWWDPERGDVARLVEAARAMVLHTLTER